MNQNSSDAITMTYSSLLVKDGKKAICVRFERTSNAGTDYAEAVLPDSTIINQKGFTEEEISQLELYLRANRDEILSQAKKITGFMHWFNK